MERSQLNHLKGAPNTFTAVHMRAYERARAQEQMSHAVVFADFVLAVVANIRNALNHARQSTYKVYERCGFRNGSSL